MEIYEIKNINEIKFEIKTYDNPFFKILGIKKDNKLIGYLSYFLIYDRIEIEYIYIDIKYRNKGYAYLLFNELIKIAKNNKCINITLEVNINNKEALNLYHKLNFKIVALRKNYYQNSDGYLMMKEL